MFHYDTFICIMQFDHICPSFPTHPSSVPFLFQFPFLCHFYAVWVWGPQFDLQIPCTGSHGSVINVLLQGGKPWKSGTASQSHAAVNTKRSSLKQAVKDNQQLRLSCLWPPHACHAIHTLSHTVIAHITQTHRINTIK